MKNTRLNPVTHTTIEKSALDFIPDWANQFYQSKKVEGVSPYTLIFYKQQLGHFLNYCEAQLITHFEEVSPNVVRQFLLWHEETGHNPGGLHAAFRVLRTFLLWYESEAEPEDWKNPIHKVKAPKLSEEPLDPIKITDVEKLVRTCARDWFGDRDKAIFFILLDTGIRARELCALDLADLDLIPGALTVNQGKGRKPRTVFVGKQARRALRAWLKRRGSDGRALFTTDDGERLSYGGLRGILVRRAKRAGVKSPTLHSFRRAFALEMLRAGVDIYSLQHLMGHAGLQVLRRYLKQNTEDLRAAHQKGSPADNWKL